MAIDFTELSLEDKGFMISHPQDFPRDIKLMIYASENEWSSKLEAVGKSLLVKQKKFETLEMINSFLEKLSIDSISKSQLTSLLTELYEMPAGTNDDLGIYLKRAAVAFHDEYSYEIELQLARVVYKEIFFNKLNAQDICFRLDNDNSSFRFYNNGIPILLVDQIVSIRDERIVAYLIYLLFKICGIADNNDALVTYTAAIGNIYSLSKETLISSLQEIKSNQIDEVRILSYINNDSNYSKVFELSKYITMNNPNSYFKDKSIYSKNDMSVVSDSIKDDTPLYFEVNKLVSGRLKEYFEDDDIIDYNGFSESDIGFLTKQGYTIGKVYINNSNWNMLTIASKDNDNYLIFRLNGKPDIYGLSLEEKDDGERKMISIEVPSDPLFQLQSNNLINIG